jgi:hypothetical protein
VRRLSVGQRRSSLAETVVRLPDPSPLDYSFDVRQQWEGVVTSVDLRNSASFFATLSAVVSPSMRPFFQSKKSRKTIFLC